MAEPLKCAACGGTFKTTGELQAHAQKAHPAPQFKCAACGGTFKTKNELDQHARASHGMR